MKKNKEKIDEFCFREKSRNQLIYLNYQKLSQFSYRYYDRQIRLGFGCSEKVKFRANAVIFMSDNIEFVHWRPIGCARYGWYEITVEYERGRDRNVCLVALD